MPKPEINLADTDMRSALRIMMGASNVDSFADLARALNVKETTFRSAVSNGSLRLADFMKVAAFMGYEVVVKSNE